MKATLLFALAVCAAAPSAVSQTSDECNYSARPARQVEACSRVIAVIEDQQTKALALMNRGIAYARQGKLREAMRDLNDSVELDPSNPLGFYNRGNLLYDVKRYGQARADVGRAIELDSSFALALLNRGMAAEKLGALDDAVSDLRAALAADPKLTAATRGLKRLGKELKPASTPQGID